MPFFTYLVIALGGAVGTILRFVVAGFVAVRLGETFPWGTLIVNVTGSFMIGFVATLAGPDGRPLVSGTARQFVMVGICGGYTTFSAFSLQTLNLMGDGEWLYAGGNAVGSVVLCVVSVWLGSITATALNQIRMT
jgi:CrcB protein